MPGKPKVLVAMSGGVDSSVAAAMLVRQGYDVVGAFMRLGSPGEELEGARGGRIGHQGCCSISDANDARIVAGELGVPFYVLNFKREFGRVIEYFVDEYAQGRTPNPCVRCNDWLKFGRLHEVAKQIGAQFVASGHYARIGRHGGTKAQGHEEAEVAGASDSAGFARARSASERLESERARSASDGVSRELCERGLARLGVARHGAKSRNDASVRLLRAVDHSKDQSYVLFGTPRARLPEMLLPIGHMPKDEVRALARQWGLPVFDKPDSQEICFVPDNDYAGLVERLRPELAGASASPGRIVDAITRAEVGEHAGQHRFTIGQRRGLSLSLGHPIYVVDRDAATNAIAVGPREMLLSSALHAGQVNWLVDAPAPGQWRRCLAKIRYNAQPVPARCRVDLGADVLKIEFDEPQSAVAPGQAAVCYDAAEPDLVLGGGWITRAERPLANLSR